MLNRQIKFFLFIGFMTVVVDFLVYQTLISLILLQVALAKGLGFVSGTLFSYFANRFWTFSDTEHAKHSAIRFALLYCMTLMINILVNAGILDIFRDLTLVENIAFLLATATSAVINFLGMKWLVFNSKIHIGRKK